VEPDPFIADVCYSNVSTYCKGKCSMKNIIALAVAIVAISIVGGQEANAQSFSFNNGYQFGAGVGAARGVHGGFGIFNPGFGFGTGFNRAFVVDRPVRPPYFAEFPPVYYNKIVRRPYGISPYAAPAGVAPVELKYAHNAGVEPVVVNNPFFKRGNKAVRSNSTVGNNTPVSVMEKAEEEAKSTKNKSTRVSNPFFKSVPESSGPIMHASFDVLEGN